ncbi:hypothetical protein BN159_4468 [Streptomyces davaonensis JCM 4913]|uniref:HTH araC/xylS-type domain-containing protein n=1 Tax=Streptomyces davaonensis (strain DSM 101723 / JCM 4913 / KCC S-0913 / 768) TaxID=1214101 RepID=K4R6X9_STRDJ|nr:helix-turn-helix domain-containing protein [Streptomyces davaonensis]CCK28847.1 hypothetical protein BN159_4468 [Streptomyces davaonensis JCM 4913]
MGELADEMPLLDLRVGRNEDCPVRRRNARYERFGHILVVTEPDGPPFLARRTWRHVAEDPADSLQLAFLDAGRSRLEQNGEETFLEEGDFTLIDTSRPFTAESPDQFAARVFMFPKAALGLPEMDLSQLTGTPLRQNHALSAFLVPFLTRLSRQGSRLHPHTRDKLVGEVTDILTTLVGEALSQMPENDAARHTFVLRVKAFIEANLNRPDLSPEVIAAAHHVSVRYLHKVFAGEDLSVSKFILRARLERCRRELARHTSREVSVRDMAHTWGFVSASHFGRVFRQAYGMTPRDWQLAAQARRR